MHSFGVQSNAAKHRPGGDGDDPSQLFKDENAIAVSYGQVRNMPIPRRDAKCVESLCKPPEPGEKGFGGSFLRDR